mgnify:FL=1
MGTMHFEQIDPRRNRARFYRLEIRRTLFDELVVIKCWGRVGYDGRRREWRVRDVVEAVALVEAEARKRIRRGYRCVQQSIP